MEHEKGHEFTTLVFWVVNLQKLDRIGNSAKDLVVSCKFEE